MSQLRCFTLTNTRGLLLSPQVDLSMAPERRDEMFSVSQSRALPQLHVDGAALGDADDILQLNDDGDLGRLLRGS